MWQCGRERGHDALGVRSYHSVAVDVPQQRGAVRARRSTQVDGERLRAEDAAADLLDVRAHRRLVQGRVHLVSVVGVRTA